MQVIATAFSGTELVGLCPLELTFPFVPNQEMHCHLGLTNNTNTLICCMLTPKVTDKYHWKGFEGYLQPMETTAVTLYRKAEEELPSDINKFEIQALILGSVDDAVEKLSALPLDRSLPFEDFFKAAPGLLGLELHRAMLTAVVTVSEEDDNRAVSICHAKCSTFFLT
jgi:hypothetical protein